MKRRDRDFVALFNSIWYKDFPVVPGHEELGTRAVWTTHIASVVKQCADLLGFFTCFETGNRTDAVIRKASGETWAKIEWEWTQPIRESVNELQKLASAANNSEEQAELMVFIGYSHDGKHEENIEKIVRSWGLIEMPLLVFLVTCKWENKRRHFLNLETHYIRSGTHTKTRVQEAIPWKVEGTKWAASNGGA